MPPRRLLFFVFAIRGKVSEMLLMGKLGVIAVIAALLLVTMAFAGAAAPSSAKPDLIPASLAILRVSATDASPIITITNIGSAPAGPSRAQIVAKDKGMPFWTYNVAVPALSPGQSYAEAVGTAPYGMNFCGPSLDMSLQSDYRNDVEESNEADNLLRIHCEWSG